MWQGRLVPARCPALPSIWLVHDRLAVLESRMQYGMLAPVKVSQVLERLREDSWYLVATRGSHRQFKHPTKPGRVTVAGKPSDDLPPGTLSSIFKQAGWKK